MDVLLVCGSQNLSSLSKGSQVPVAGLTEGQMVPVCTPTIKRKTLLMWMFLKIRSSSIAPNLLGKERGKRTECMCTTHLLPVRESTRYTFIFTPKIFHYCQWENRQMDAKRQTDRQRDRQIDKDIQTDQLVYSLYRYTRHTLMFTRKICNYRGSRA